MYFEDRFYKALSFDKPKDFASLNKEGYAYVCFSNNQLLRNFKSRISKLSIPLMGRKWNKIDCSKVSRYETAKTKRDNVVSLYKKGIKMSKIARQLQLPYITVWTILKRKGAK